MESSTISRSHLCLGVLGGVALAMGVYTGVNYAVAETTPTRMLPSVIDDQIPFIAEAMLVYGGIYALALTPLCLLADRRVLARGALAYAILLGAALPVWVLWPVTVPRAPIVVDDLWSWAVAFMRYVDPPANCFPSMHVGETVLAALMCWRMDRITGAVVGVFAVLVWWSTMAWTAVRRRALRRDPRHRGRRPRSVAPAAGPLLRGCRGDTALGGRTAWAQFIVVALPWLDIDTHTAPPVTAATPTVHTTPTAVTREDLFPKNETPPKNGGTCVSVPHETESVDAVEGSLDSVDRLGSGVAAVGTVAVHVGEAGDEEVGRGGRDHGVGTANHAVRAPAQGVECGAGGPGTLCLTGAAVGVGGGLLDELVKRCVVCKLSGLDAVNVAGHFGALGAVLHRDEVRDSDSGQNTDNRDNNHEFD